MVKGVSTEDSEIKLGDVTIQPTQFDDILVGAVNTDMTVAWVKHFPAFAASNGRHTTQNKEMNIQNGNLYLMGHVVGGFGTDKTEALIEGSSTMQTGFLIKCSAVDGTWLGGAIGENSIGGYYGAFENENGKIYTYGYALGEAYLVTYNASTWDIENEYSLVKGGSTTAWGCPPPVTARNAANF